MNQDYKKDTQAQARVVDPQIAATCADHRNQRQIAVTILATAMIDLLLAEKSCARGAHKDSTS